MPMKPAAASRPGSASYVLAVGAVLLALVARWALVPFIGPHAPYLLVLPVIVLAGLLLGCGPAVAAGIVAIAATENYLVEPVGVWHFDTVDFRRAAIVFATGLLAGGLGQFLRRTRSAALTAQARLEAILASINDGFIQLDSDWRLTYVSPRAAEMASRPRETLLGQPLWQVLPSTADTGFQRALEQALAQQTPVHFEHHYPAWDRWLEHHAYPTVDGLALIFTDITHRKQAEAQLRDREERFRTLAEAMPHFVWQTDAAGQFEYASSRWFDFTGLTPDTTRHDGWTTACHPEDLPLFRAAWTQALQTGAEYDLECRIRRADGAYRWFRIKGAPVRDAHHRITRWVGTGTDIHDHKQADEQLRRSHQRFLLAASAMNEGLWEWDLQSSRVWWNEAYDQLYGPRPKDTSSGRQWWVDHLHEQDRDRVLHCLDSTLQSPRTRWVCEYRFRRADGSYAFIMDNAVIARDAHGQATCITGAMLDLTELKQAEEELHAAQALLVQANAQLEQKVQERTAALRHLIAELESYSHSITHDMRAPLRSMRVFSQTLLHEYSRELTPPAQDLLQRIAAAADRLDALVRDVLSYNQLSHDPADVQPLDLDALVRDIVEQYPGLQPPQADIQILPPLLPVTGNLALLTQCVSNLLDNAVKFVPKNAQPQVRVWTEARNGHIRLWVQDNGIGIAPQHQQRIFEIFERLNDRTLYKGTGIGLSIVRKAVQRMGGRVGLESALGQGSRFWIELPATQQPQKILDPCPKAL